MPTLRDRVRETLSAREPGDREAKAQLESILVRSRARRTPRLAWLLVAAPALAAAVLVLTFALPRTREPSVAQGRPTTPSADRGVHLYLHVNGEPKERAIALDLDSKGAL